MIKCRRRQATDPQKFVVVPTARLTPQNKYILNLKHNVGSTNLDLKQIESTESNFELNRMNLNSIESNE